MFCVALVTCVSRPFLCALYNFLFSQILVSRFYHKVYVWIYFKFISVSIPLTPRDQTYTFAACSIGFLPVGAYLGPQNCDSTLCMQQRWTYEWLCGLTVLRVET
jgi:hypothetical protein